MALVFGSALWNGSLLAPLDIPAALYAKFHWLDETQGPVPRNHYTVDIFDHELPRQYAIYRAVQSGEFPWWDPFTDYGRPLAADAHVSGTDVLRLGLYRCLPFVPAYNLTKLLHSFLLGLGAFLLLRYWRHAVWRSLAGALAFQFAGTFVVFQTPLCVSAAAVWYAWIWLAWSCFLRSRKIFWVVAAGLFCALSIAAGNQQTHAFLAVFAACFFLGNVWHDRKSWKPALPAAVIAPLLGALVALPVLVPQMELYILCERHPAFAEFSKIQILTGIASLLGLFPWALGTFRTIDASKFLRQDGLSFCVFIGTAALVLSLVGALAAFQRSRRTPQGCVAFLLAVVYFVISSTPLVAVFYTRLAGLAVLGLVVLAAEGAQQLEEGEISRWQKRLGVLALAAVFGALLSCNAFALLYPRLKDRVESALLEREKQRRSLDSAPDLRRFQARNLQREISVMNPETVLSVTSAGILLAAFSSGSPQKRARWLWLALVVNIGPELIFAERFTTKSPVGHWWALVEGGPEQQRVMSALKGGLRLREQSPGRFENVLPGATALLYRVHMVNGYSSFMLQNISALWDGKTGFLSSFDATYSSVERGKAAGVLQTVTQRPTLARFQWAKTFERPVRIVAESLNTITVEVEDGAPGSLWRTDRYYPGWKLVNENLETQVTDGCFLSVKVPAGRQVLAFEYSPRFQTVSNFVGGATLLGCALCLTLRKRGHHFTLEFEAESGRVRR